MGSLAFKLHFSIICHTKGIMSVSYKTQKAAGLMGGLHLMWRAPGLGGAQELHFHSSGFLFVDAASPAGQDLLGKLCAGGQSQKALGQDKSHPKTPAGPSLTLELFLNTARDQRISRSCGSKVEIHTSHWILMKYHHSIDILGVYCSLQLAPSPRCRGPAPRTEHPPPVPASPPVLREVSCGRLGAEAALGVRELLLPPPSCLSPVSSSGSQSHCPHVRRERGIEIAP